MVLIPFNVVSLRTKPKVVGYFYNTHVIIAGVGTPQEANRCRLKLHEIEGMFLISKNGADLSLNVQDSEGKLYKVSHGWNSVVFDFPKFQLVQGWEPRGSEMKQESMVIIVKWRQIVHL